MQTSSFPLLQFASSCINQVFERVMMIEIFHLFFSSSSVKIVCVRASVFRFNFLVVTVAESVAALPIFPYLKGLLTTTRHNKKTYTLSYIV